MRVEAITYTENQYLVGYDDEMTSEELERLLSHNYNLEGGDFTITSRRAAEAADTSTEEDLATLTDLARSYDHVDFIDVQLN